MRRWFVRADTTRAGHSYLATTASPITQHHTTGRTQPSGSGLQPPPAFTTLCVDRGLLPPYSAAGFATPLHACYTWRITFVDTALFAIFPNVPPAGISTSIYRYMDGRHISRRTSRRRGEAVPVSLKLPSRLARKQTTFIASPYCQTLCRTYTLRVLRAVWIAGCLFRGVGWTFLHALYDGIFPTYQHLRREHCACAATFPTFRVAGL